MLPGGNSPSDVFFLLLLVQSFSAITSDTSPHQMSARSFPLKKAGRRRPGAGNYYVRTPTADFKLSQRCQEVGLRMGPLRAGGFAAAGAVLGTLGTTSVSAALGSMHDCGSHIPSCTLSPRPHWQLPTAALVLRDPRVDPAVLCSPQWGNRPVTDRCIPGVHDVCRTGCQMLPGSLQEPQDQAHFLILFLPLLLSNNCSSLFPLGAKCYGQSFSPTRLLWEQGAPVPGGSGAAMAEIPPGSGLARPEGTASSAGRRWQRCSSALQQ